MNPSSHESAMLDLFMCQWSNQGYVKGRAQNYAEGGSKNILRARVQIYLKNSPVCLEKVGNLILFSANI